jgi:hypothetical protein
VSIEKTINAYTQEHLNCAQSIYRGFQESVGVPESTVDDARALGGGRAFEGRCGALYAAMELAPSSEIKASLIDTFVKQAGSDKCREIKKLGKFKCIDCVRLAAKEVSKILAQK